jgi:hypothetical protein
MENINEEQFNQMLGTESIDRMNYIDLLEQTKMHINANAMISLLMVKLHSDTPEMIDQLGPELGGEMICKILQIIGVVHLNVLKQLSGEHVARHHNYVYGSKLTVEDILENNSVEQVTAYIKEIVGFDIGEMLDAWDDNDEEREE